MEERRVLDVVIASEPAYQAALKFLLLWRPNLASGQPVAANEPILSNGPENGSANCGGYSPPPPHPLPGDGPYTSLTELPSVKGTPPPSVIRLPTGEERPINYWWQVLFETANWLARTDKLTSSQCPVQLGNQTKKYIVNVQALHPDGQGFYTSRQLSNGLFCEVSVSARAAVRQSRNLLERFGVNPASVSLKLD